MFAVNSHLRWCLLCAKSYGNAHRTQARRPNHTWEKIDRSLVLLQKWNTELAFWIFDTSNTKILVIYQTRETVFYKNIQTPRRELKIRRAAEFGEIRGVWIADETLSRMSDISSQSKQKLINEEVKSSKSILIRTRYPKLLHGCGLILCFNLMNY